MYSATAASFLTISITFTFASVLTIFKSLSGEVLGDIPYGVSLILLSILTLLTGISSPSTQKTFTTTILISLAAFWNSVGISHLWNGVVVSANHTIGPTPDVDLYFPGFLSYLLIFIVLLCGSLAHKDFRLGAVLSLLCVVLFVFEILNLWVDIGGTDVIYILLALITAFFWLRNALDNFKRSNTIVPKDKSAANSKSKTTAQNFTIIWYAMNVVSFSVFASQITSVITIPSQSFSWCFTSGFFQIVMGISALRRHDHHGSAHIILHGVYWISMSISLLIMSFLDLGDSLPIPTLSVFIALFVSLAIIEFSLELLRCLYYVVLAIFTLALCVEGTRGLFVGIMGLFALLVSIYGLSAQISRVGQISKKLPIGKLIFEKEKVKAKLRTLWKKTNKAATPSENSNKNIFSNDAMLGYSKYVTMETTGFACNAVAALSILWLQPGSESLAIPPVVLIGGVVQFVSGFVGFSRGLTFESLSFLIYASFWSIWGFVIGMGLLNSDSGSGIIIGCIGFLTSGLVLSALSTVINKVWIVISVLFELIVLGFLLRGANVVEVDIFEIVVSLLFALACLYASLSSAIKNAWGREILPMGLPSIQVSKLHSEGAKAVWANARRATGVKKIADILNSGGICGIPTDTVYCLVAACNQPEAVERAYNTKKLAEDRPMSVWISSTSQLSGAKEALGDLLWDFMHELWPSNVSLVLKKGDWINSLGLGYAEKYIGRPDTIAIRIPDSSITCHLIDQTGPIALTSANPTGEADTTHHLQVLAKLGVDNCDGILCDGPSRENAASTVVDCRNINDGKLGFFRIGLTPKSKVEEIFEKVKLRQCDASSDSGISQSSSTHKCESSILDKDLVLTNLDESESLSHNVASLGKNGKIQVDSYSKIGGRHVRDKSVKQNPIYTESS